VDPLGGSYYIESLTDAIVQHARELIREVEALGGMTKAVASGMPKQRIEEAAAQRQARIERGEDVIVGVNKYRLEKDNSEVEVLAVDNTKVREAQLRRLAEVKRNRDDARVAEALDALTEAARNGTGNLLALAIEATRRRATVGEISAALEKVYGRHEAVARMTPGVYAQSYEGDPAFARVRDEVKLFTDVEGEAPSILVVKMGQDGHDRGAKVISNAFNDFGFKVSMGPLFQTPTEAVAQAKAEGVHVVGVSTLAGGHKSLVPEMIELLKAEGLEDVIVVCGGVIPAQDYQALYDAGVHAIFGPGSNIPDAASQVLKLIPGKNR
jgi:methylmalonyl-CoA mutase